MYMIALGRLYKKIRERIMNMKKKISALLLALVMALSLLPVSAFAATTPQITKFTKLWGSPALGETVTIDGKAEGTLLQLGTDGKATGKTGFDATCFNYEIYVSANTAKVRPDGSSAYYTRNAFDYSDAAKASLYTVGSDGKPSYIVENATSANNFRTGWYNNPIQLSGDSTKAVIELFADKADTKAAATYTFTFIRKAMDVSALRGLLESLDVSSLQWPTDCDYVGKLKANYDALSSTDKSGISAELKAKLDSAVDFASDTRVPAKLEITKAATQLNYLPGQSFDPTGMVLTATYADGSTRELKDSTLYTVTPAPVGKSTKVTITYNTVKTEQAITVTDLQGSGTKEAPYKLNNAADLVTLSSFVAAGGATKDTYFDITANITLPDNWTPIGSLKEGKAWSTTLDKSGFNAFSGIIDGGNHTITVPKGSKTMLGAVSGGKLSNLNIYGEKIDGYGVVEYYYVDRANAVKVEIDNVTLKSGTHTKYSGFIGGYASGVDVVIIRNSTVEAGVVIGDDGTYPEWAEELKGAFSYPWGPTGLQMNDMIGSFGGCFNGTIENCTSAAKVYGRNYVGGIAGFKGQSMGDCIVRNCTFTGEVIATGKFVGGIMGGGYSATSAPNTPATTVESCAFTGKVTGATNVGGIFGGEELLVQCWGNGIGLVRANYANGTITATDKDGVKGGIIGYMNSLNRYTVVSDNYYMAGTADKGIGSVAFVETLDATGTVGTGWYKVTFNGAHYGRGDDPTGADADKLAASFTAAELASGAVTEKLNTALVGQGWTGTTPTRTTEKHVVGLRSTKLISNPEPTATQNGGLSLSTPITVNYSDGTTEEITLKDCVLTGLDLTKTGYQVCTANYKGYALVFGVNVRAGGTAPEDVITVTVSVLGDYLHDLTADQCHTLAANNLTPWLTDVTVTMDKDATVLDALQKACSAQGLKLGVVDSSYGGKYINSVTSVTGVALTDSSNKASDGKSYCGWMFTVDGTMPMTTVDATALTDGAKLCLYFEDDYSLAYVDSAVKAIDAIVATDCRTIKAAEDATRYLSPVAVAKVANYAKLQEALKGLDKISHNSSWKVTTPATATTDGLEELICSDCGHVLSSRVIPATGNGGSVSTGDSSNMVLYMGLSVAALLGLAVIPTVHRKKA